MWFRIRKRIVGILTTRRAMLNEYFSVGITEDGLVETLPLLLRDYTPNLDKLPLFFMRLGPQVRSVSCFLRVLPRAHAGVRSSTFPCAGGLVGGA